MVNFVDKFFIKHAPMILVAAVTVLHTLGFLAEQYLTGGASLAVWAAITAIDAALASKCGSMVQAAFKDNLTALNNRHYFSTAVVGRINRSQKSGAGISLLMIDIDDFKQINDSRGHGAGDAVLRQFADLLRAIIRQDDDAIRWGGEEFLLILAGADKQRAYQFAERIRATVERHRFGQGQDIVPVTVSIGIASAAATADIEQLTKLADDALYRAKQTKNAVVD